MPRIFYALFMGGLLVASSPRVALACEVAHAVEQTPPTPHIGSVEREGTQSAESGLIEPTWILAIATALLCAFTGAMWLATWKLARDSAKTGAENAKAAKEQQAVMTNQQIAMQAQAAAMAKLAAAAEASSKATEAAAKITGDTFELTRHPFWGMATSS